MAKSEKELRQLREIRDWLAACVSAAEADGYQEHGDAPWNKEDGSPVLETDYGTGQMFVVYEDWEFFIGVRRNRRLKGDGK